MKKLIIFTTLIIFTNSYSQTFSNREIKKLNSFGINLDYNEISREKQFNLDTILLKEKKRKRNKISGIVFTSVGALTAIFGSLIILKQRRIIKDNSDSRHEGVGLAIGSMVIGIGVIELGISIPICISSNKRKKERDKLIELYK